MNSFWNNGFPLNGGASDFMKLYSTHTFVLVIVAYLPSQKMSLIDFFSNKSGKQDKSKSI